MPESNPIGRMIGRMIGRPHGGRTRRHLLGVVAAAAGLKIYGGTILPFKDDTLGFYSADNEHKRQAVNTWMRVGGEYDGVVDFDAALRDPTDRRRLLARYDSGDHLHPNDAGMVAMAEAVPLRFFY